MDNEPIIMSQKEARRYEVIKQVINKEINNTEAAETLNLTNRQIQRLKQRVDEEGLKGLIHKGRGKPSNRKIAEEEKGKILKIIKRKYSDFGPTFAAEKLEECHKIKRDPKTIRSIMIGAELWKPKLKRPPEYRSWRQRRASFGELIQYDGSYEYWFEDRAEKCCLLAAIDDAKGEITQAKFDAHEGVEPTFKFWEEYLEKQGKPMNIYVDKFSTYSMNHKLAKENPDTLIQFERAMKSLGIEVITAHSSQAKGRVERLFKTLQDRLIKELRLEKISTLEEANEFLEKTFIPKFNAKFSVEARNKANVHKKVTEADKKNFPSIFARHYERIIRNDFTVSYKSDWYQLKETQAVAMFPCEVITVEERFNSEIYFRLRGKYLNYKKLPEKPRKISEKPKIQALAPSIPASNHPWRKFQFGKN